jgi:hypothetical protein
MFNVRLVAGGASGLGRNIAEGRARIGCAPKIATAIRDWLLHHSTRSKSAASVTA